jgi:hypothetical protein
MPWETFDKRATPMLKTPSVTIQAKGIFSLNASAYAQLGSPEAVELLYDRDAHRIGLQPAPPTSPTAYPARPVGTGKTHLVVGATFLKYYSIPFGVPTRYEVRVEDGVLVIDLNQEGRVAPSNRSRAVTDGELFKGEGALR